MAVITDTADTSAVPENETTKRSRKPATAAGVDPALVNQLVAQAREQGLQLSGEGGLLQQLTKIVLESALEGEITDHLGYDRHDPAGDGSGNSRNGTRTKTVLTDVGPVQVSVPRDRAGSFEPTIVRKRQRRLSGVEDLVLSLRSAPTSPRCTARTCPARRSPRSPTRSSTGWPSGRTGRSTPSIR
jgi:putative transposase